VFATLPRKIVAALQEEQFFYIWNDRTTEARFMCSFDTTEEEISNFGRKIKALLASA
jgi:threonine aldolase